MNGDGLEKRAERRLTAILAADVAGYSRLMGADEGGTLRALKAHRHAVIDPKIAEHRGRIVKTTGDGLLVEFASVVDGVECAREIQRAITESNAQVPPDRRLEFRIGVNLGDVIIDGDDIFGDGVNIAARLEGLAEPGGVCVSRVVRDQVRDKLDIAFEDLGERRVKNIARPLHVYRIAPAAIAPPTGEPAATPEPPTLALPDRPSIAVLPFTNMSGDPEQDYFADGMVEDIITALSRFKELFVIARNSTFVYKGRAVDIRQVARELGVRYVLEGSVRKAGNRVRITGQLIDAATNAHLWADRFDGALEDVFDLQDRITENVVGALLPTLRQAEIERAGQKLSANLDAYDYLLRALPHVIANTVAEAGSAVRLLNEALRLYPDYAYAHGLLSNAYAQLFRSAAGSEREEWRALAVSHARKAIALGANDSSALAPAGFILLIARSDAGGARAALDKAVALNPNSAAAFAYRSMARACMGDAEAAIDDATKAIRLSPRDPAGYMPLMGMVVARIVLRQYDEAALWAKKAIELNPRFPMSYVHLIVAECGRGDIAEAERQMKRLADLLPGFEPGTLPRLLEIFPEPLRSEELGILRAAGLIPAVA